MRAWPNSDGVSVATYAITATAMHRHVDVVEIVYVLRGTLEVRVSSEQYLLEEGDYALLNAGDTHLFVGGSQNLTVVCQLDLHAFAPALPELRDTIFACESFDLPRFLGTEASLRERLLRLFCAAAPDRPKLAAALFVELLKQYGIEHYYDRRRTLNDSRRAVMRSIISLVREHAAERQVLELVSSRLHYSKGALSRITRDTLGMSFRELLAVVRLTSAETLLLDTEHTMVHIAAACGFSDVKYFTRAFRDWFGCTPAKYRNDNQWRLDRDDSLESLGALPTQIVAAHLRGALPSGRPTRRSTTPINILMAEPALEPRPAITAPTDQTAPPPLGRPHLMPIRVHTDRIDRTEQESWQRQLISANRSVYTPVLVVAATEPDLARRIAAQLLELRRPDTPLWITYQAGYEHAAERLATTLAHEYATAATPLLLAEHSRGALAE